MLDKQKYTLLVIIGASFLFHFSILVFAHYAINPDSHAYIKNAEHLLNLNFDEISITRPLFYSVLIAFFIPIFKNPEISGIAVSLILSSILPAVVFWFAEELFDRKTGILSAILITFNPILCRYSFSVFTEITYTTIVFLSITVGWKAIRTGHLLSYLAVGIMAGLSYLTRYEGFTYGVFIAFFLFLKMILNWHQNRTKRIFGILLFIIAFTAIISPYIIFLHEQTGCWTLSIKLRNFAEGILPQYKYKELTPDQSLLFIKTHLGNIGLKFLRNLGEGLTTGISSIISPLLLIFVGLGLFKEKWERGQIFPRLYLMAFIFPSFITAAFSHINPRYYVSALPIILIFIARGLNTFDDWLKGFSDLTKSIVKKVLQIPNLSQSVVVIIFMVLSLNPALRVLFHLPPIYHVEYKETGLWMKEHLPKDSIFIGRSSVNYYAGGFIEPDTKTLRKLRTVEDLRKFKKGKDSPVYRFIEERFNRRYGPMTGFDLAFLIDESKAPDFLKPVYINNRYPGAKTILYEILDVEENNK